LGEGSNFQNRKGEEEKTMGLDQPKIRPKKKLKTMKEAPTIGIITT